MEKIDFPEWLRQELEKRDWSQVDLSRKTKISPTQIARILSGERGFGVEALVSISNALEVSPITVLRKAGLIPKGNEDQISFDDWKYLLEKMTPEERDEVWRISQMKVEIRQEKEKASRAKNFKPGKVRK
ncbi:MAG: XRE family transcriptional regulator [Chloroflexi bacterium]|nr:MAG: XRE family transcriptional regulator [Chloroflexota bacterium]